MTGHRYCLMPSAAAFIDPLFSSGINLTLSGIDMLVKRLLNAFEADDFSIAPFREIDAFFEANHARYDEFISSAFVSFRHFALWDAWYRVWVAGLLVATALNANLYLKFLETNDRSLFERSEDPPYNRALGSAFPDFHLLYEEALAQVEAVRAGRCDPEAAAARICALFKATTYVPHYWRFHDPAVRTTPAFTVGGMTRMYCWYVFRSPRPVRALLFDWSPLTAYRYIVRSIRDQAKASRRRRRSFVRDVFKAWNRDWEKTVPGSTVQVGKRRTWNPEPEPRNLDYP